ncbi:MAG: TolC family protein [Bacteroidales bacterium]|nr:TolC family protein [Bacteroidales bacterium]
MKKLYIISALLLVVISANAQEIITLKRCREMAVTTSEDIKISKKQIDKTVAEKAAMKTMYLPKLSGSATGIYVKDDIKTEMYLPTYVVDPTTGKLVPNVTINPATGKPVIGPDGNPLFNMYAMLPLEVSLKGAYMAGLKIEQPIFAGGKIIAGNKMASIGVQMAKYNDELQQMNTIYEADNAYWLYVSVNEKVKLAKKASMLLDALVKRVENSYNAGMVNRNELLKVRVKYNNSLLDLQKAESGHELTRMSLCRVTGLDYSTDIVATDTIIDTDKTIISNTGNENITDRPEYKMLSGNIDIKRQNVNLTRGDYLPTAGIAASYNHIGGIKVSGKDYTSNNMNVMVSVKIPLFHWREGKRKITSAKISHDISTYEFEKNVKLMKLEVEQAKLNLKDSYTRIEIAQSALKQAEENLRVSTDNYETGMEVITDHLMAQTEWQKAHSELIDAKVDFKLKESAYLKATAKLAIK